MYIDPGTGSMIFSLVIAIATTLVFSFRAFFIKLKFAFLKGKRQEVDKHNLGIVIYSDDKRYWNVFGPVCREAERREVPIVYMTQSEDDSAFLEHFKYIKTMYIGEGNRGIAKMNFLNADIVFATTPNLDVFQWKRSRLVKYYVHFPHCVYELLSYRMFGLDSFDAVLLTGEFQKDYIRRLEALRGSPKKELQVVGYPPLDENALRLRQEVRVPHSENERTILLAPSWGQSSLLSRCGKEILCALVKTGYKIIVRPHPQSSKSEKALLQELQEKFPENKRFSWNFDTDNFECLRSADLLIGDYSGTMFEAAITFNMPIVYAPYVFDSSIYDAAWICEKDTWRFKSLAKIAVQFDIKHPENLKEIIDKTLSDKSLNEMRELVALEAWTYRGQSAKLIVDYLVNKQVELKAKAESTQESIKEEAV